ERFARVEAATKTATTGPTTMTWNSAIQPIFARSCAICHLPGGVSGTDLSTAAAWNSEHDAIRDRVVIKHTMPPSGHPLADADRAAIGAWVEQAPALAK
ncbi:MAG: cytochrome c, partial [Polyangiaceae bacterium]